jgi:KGK domain
MIDRFESLENGEVISIQHDTQVLSGHRTFRVGELNDEIKNYLASAIDGWSEQKNGWFTAQGIDCEALRFGSNGWQKGRIRLCLEFCPDEPNLSAHSAINSHVSIAPNAPELTAPTLGSPQTHAPDPVNSANSQDRERNLSQFDRDRANIPVDALKMPEIGTSLPTTEIAPNISETLMAAMPIAGIATIGTVAVAAAVATPDLQATNLNLAIPYADTILEPEEHPVSPISSNSGGLDEIAFDFDLANNDRGRMVPNGMMELDLTDLGLDFSEHDLLSFEAAGMSDPSEEFGNLHDLGQPENSGMLIDEVWNEMNQGNWPGIN